MGPTEVHVRVDLERLEKGCYLVWQVASEVTTGGLHPFYVAMRKRSGYEREGCEEAEGEHGERDDP